MKPGFERKCPKCGLILKGKDDLRKAERDRLSKFPKVIKPKH
jgi:ribosomal protein L34E